MGYRQALSREEKEQIYRHKLAGKSLPEIAKQIGCSYECARKWWRVGRDGGFEAIRAKRVGRQARGALSQFSQAVRETALDLKREHKRWGASRVLIEMEQASELAGERLPSPSRLAAYFKEVCPECVASYKEKEVPAKKPPQARDVHEVWQMDAQEAHRLTDGQIATVCSIRDPVGAVVIATDAFAVQTKTRWRKLTLDEVRDLFRQGFTRWSTLPDAVQTDNETRLGGHPSDSFPSLLTLWLVGLGIEHRFSRPGQPTDQAQVERQHLTLDAWTEAAADRADLDAFKQALERELNVHNRLLPSRASTCNGRSPLNAFPQLLTPRRSYCPEGEHLLFSLERVYAFLAPMTFPRKTSAKGQVRVGRSRYNIGSAFAKRELNVRLDPRSCQWCFFDAEDDAELARKPAKGLDFQTLTGLPDNHVSTSTRPLQPTLPFVFW